jgi:hypothetical protein
MEFQNRMIALSTQHLTLEESDGLVPNGIFNNLYILDNVTRAGVVSTIKDYRGNTCIAFECSIISYILSSQGIQTHEHTKTTTFNIIGPFHEAEQEDENALRLTGYGQTRLFNLSINFLSEYHLSIIRQIIESGSYLVKTQDLAMLNDHFLCDVENYDYHIRRLPFKIEF